VLQWSPPMKFDVVRFSKDLTYGVSSPARLCREPCIRSFRDDGADGSKYDRYPVVNQEAGLPMHEHRHVVPCACGDGTDAWAVMNRPVSIRLDEDHGS